MRYLILLTIVFITGCKKADEISPTITIQNPLNQSIYNYGETIEVRADVHDNKQLVSVSFSLLNSSFTSVLEGEEYRPESTMLSIESGLYLNDIHLESGQYYLKIQASDGENSTSAYREVNVVGAPKLMTKIVYVDKPGTDYELSSLDSIGQQEFEYSIGAECLGIEINSYDQVLAVSGLNNPLRLLDVESMQVFWEELPGNNPPYDYYSGLDLINTRFIYSGATTGSKSIRNRFGNTIAFSNEMEPGYQSEEALDLEGYLYVDEFNPIQNKRYLAKYFLSTGSYVSRYFLDIDIISMHASGVSELVLFGNMNGVGEVVIFDINSGLFDAAMTLPGVVVDAESIGNGKYALALSSGIYIYDVLNSSLTQINTMIVKDLCFQSLSNTIITIGDNTLDELSVSGTILESYSVSNGKFVGILYNK